MNGNILITTGSGQSLNFTVYPMDHFPSANANAWVSFLRASAYCTWLPGDAFQIAETDTFRIQRFMRKHGSEALVLVHGRNDPKFYTVAGSRLVRCNPFYRLGSKRRQAGQQR